ncbi:hypothetical protein [Lactiplantibacillus plantarum]|uniref:hypothetical protein n=1 Tax=Lactiplantibacillus plantarum TaxID=1590 RepID=UPI0009783AF6|nr:hypothetical protein [Lactiplantibacillus plantarum]
MNSKEKIVRIIGDTALLRQILVVLYLYGIIIFALLIGGASVLVAYERQPERLFFQTLTYALIFFLYMTMLLLVERFLRFSVLPYLKRRVWKEIAKDIETQVLRDNDGHSLEVKRLKRDSEWRQLVWPYREAKKREKRMGLPMIDDGKKWTRKKAIAVRNKDLQERYDYAEKHSLAYAAPFYLRCYGMPEILEP